MIDGLTLVGLLTCVAIAAALWKVHRREQRRPKVDPLTDDQLWERTGHLRDAEGSALPHRGGGAA